jgi:hypothetical protein
MDPEIAARAASLSAALAKLPDRPGPVFRGALLEPDQIALYLPGTTRSEPAFLSAASDPSHDFPGNTLFIVDSKHAKDVSAFSAQSESEVVFDKGTSFRVIGNSLDRRSARHVITLMETDDQTPTEKEIRSAQKRGRQFLRRLHSVPVAERKPLTSDKFAGPIAGVVLARGGEVDDDDE